MPPPLNRRHRRPLRSQAHGGQPRSPDAFPAALVSLERRPHHPYRLPPPPLLRLLLHPLTAPPPVPPLCTARHARILGPQGHLSPFHLHPPPSSSTSVHRAMLTTAATFGHCRQPTPKHKTPLFPTAAVPLPSSVLSLTPERCLGSIFKPKRCPRPGHSPLRRSPRPPLSMVERKQRRGTQERKYRRGKRNGHRRRPSSSPPPAHPSLLPALSRSLRRRDASLRRLRATLHQGGWTACWGCGTVEEAAERRRSQRRGRGRGQRARRVEAGGRPLEALATMRPAKGKN